MIESPKVGDRVRVIKNNVVPWNHVGKTGYIYHVESPTKVNVYIAHKDDVIPLFFWTEELERFAVFPPRS